jgi:hypothetical protein
MSTQLSAEGLQIEQQSSSPSGVSGSALLYTKGNVVYMNPNNGGEVQLTPFDIDQLSALGGANLHETQDHFVVSDNGTEKKILFEDVANSIFANVSGQAAIAASGSLSLDVSAITAQTNMSGDVADADELMINDGGALKRIDFSVLRDAVFNDVSGDATIADGGVLTILANAVQTGMVHDDVATELAQGAGLEAANGQMSISSAQTVISSLLHDSLVVGRATGNDDITFSDDTIDLMTNNASRLKVQTANTTISNNLVVEGNLTVEGSAVEVQQGFVVTASIQFEGSTPDGNELTLTTADPTADRTVTIPDLSGHVPLLAGAISTANVTAAEFALLDGGSSVGTTAVADGHGLFMNQGGTMGHTTVQTLAAYLDDEITAMPNLVQAGALDAGSITSGFGAIDIGSSNISGGAVSGSSTLDIDGAAKLNGAVSVKALTATRVVFAGADGLLSDDSDMTFSGDTLTVTKLGAYEQAGAVDFSDEAMTNVNIDSGAIDGTVIGAASAASGTFTMVSVSQQLAVTQGLAVGGGYGATGLSINTDGDILTDSDITVVGQTHFGHATGYGGDGATMTNAGALSMKGALSVGASGAGANVVFYGTNADDKLSWDASANKALFTDNDVLYLSMGGESGSYAIDVGNGSAANAGNRGKIRAAAFVTYSDRNLKKDIAPMNDALDKVMKLDAVSYKMKNDNRQEIGFIAQDVAKVVPEVCALDADGVGRGIDYSRMSALLAGAVKSQQLQIEELKTIITKLQK